MRESIDRLIDLLEAKGPFEGSFELCDRAVERVQPGDARLVGLVRWDLHRNGSTCPQGTDVLLRRKTEYGENILYVNFRKPNTHWLDENQIIYRVTLNS